MVPSPGGASRLPHLPPKQSKLCKSVMKQKSLGVFFFFFLTNFYLFDEFTNFFVGVPVVRLQGHGVDFPQKDTKGVNIRLHCKFPKQQSFGRHPADRQHSLTLYLRNQSMVQFLLFLSSSGNTSGDLRFFPSPDVLFPTSMQKETIPHPREISEAALTESTQRDNPQFTLISY